MYTGERWRSLVEVVGAAVVVSDDGGVVRFANSHARSVFADLLPQPDAPPDAITADHDWQLLAEDGTRLLMPDETLLRVRRGGAEWRDEVVGVVVGDGEPRWFLRSLAPLERDDEPGRYDVVATFVEITARRELEARLEQQAATDPLTGIVNRFGYQERLAQAVARADRDGEPLVVALIDVDDFKSCNDVHGHPVGDAVLAEVARRLESQVRAGDVVARLGGDEFGVVLDRGGEAAAHELGARIVAAFDAPVQPRGTGDAGPLKVTVSVGAAVRRARVPVEEVRDAADAALFAAKHAGRGGYVVYDAEAERGPPIGIDVEAADAHAWAAHMAELRAEIAVRKAEGLIPESTGAPPSVYRLLQEMTARIAELPAEGGAHFMLPGEHDLTQFVFHHTNVLRWVDGLRGVGILEHEVPLAAHRFWQAVADNVEPGVAGIPTAIGGHHVPEGTLRSPR